MQKQEQEEANKMSNPFQQACDILEQQTRVDIAKEELKEAEDVMELKKNNLFNEKAKLEELANEYECNF